MKVLVACEESQAVTKEFRKLGHEAYSCDILPCSGGHPEWHLQQDVIPLLKEDWSMIIAFPPCTHLAVSGAAYWKEKQKDGRQQSAIDFFMLFTDNKCKKIVIENPVGIISTKWRKPDQIVDPFLFGVPERKKTCLWLKGLLLLKPTKIVKAEPYKTILRKTGDKAGQPYNYYWRQGKSAHDRSKTFQCIAKAMAEQWGK